MGRGKFRTRIHRNSPVSEIYLTLQTQNSANKLSDVHVSQNLSFKISELPHGKIPIRDLTVQQGTRWITTWHYSDERECVKELWQNKI